MQVINTNQTGIANYNDRSFELEIPAGAQIGDVVVWQVLAAWSAARIMLTPDGLTVISSAWPDAVQNDDPRFTGAGSNANKAFVYYREIDGNELASYTMQSELGGQANVGTQMWQGMAIGKLIRFDAGERLEDFERLVISTRWISGGDNTDHEIYNSGGDIVPNPSTGLILELYYGFNSGDVTVEEGAGSGTLIDSYTKFRNGSTYDNIVSFHRTFEDETLQYSYFYTDTAFKIYYGGLLILSSEPIPLPDLDQPVRVELSEDARGSQVQTGISTTYLLDESTKRNIGEYHAIDDEFNPEDFLYQYWINDRKINGALVTYSGQDMKGRLANKRLYLPPSFSLAGPLTGRDALLALLSHFKATGADWLEWEPSEIPEFTISTSFGLYAPVLRGMIFEQGDPLKKETLFSALDWINRVLTLFADNDYKFRVNQAGRLHVKPPYWATAGEDLILSFPTSPEVTLTQSNSYRLNYSWASTEASVKINIRKRSEVLQLIIDADVAESVGSTFSSTSLDFEATILLAFGEIAISITSYAGAEDFIITGTITGFASSGAVEIQTLSEQDLSLENDVRTEDLDWLYFVAEFTATPLEYVSAEAWEPAYLDHEPVNRIPAVNDALGRSFRNPGKVITRQSDGTVIEQWLPDPGGAYARTKIGSSWALAEGTLGANNDPVSVTITADFYWSSAILGAGLDGESQHSDPAAYPTEVGFTYMNHNDTDWQGANADPFNAPDKFNLPYTYPTITVSKDGSPSYIRWRIDRSPAFSFQEGLCEGNVRIWYENGQLRFVRERYFQHSTEGGTYAWTVAPRFELNATASVLRRGEETLTAIWGESAEDEASLPGLTAAKEAYPDRPKKVIDASSFDVDVETLLLFAESFVRRHYTGAELISYTQISGHPVRPDNINDLYRLPNNEYGVLVARDYIEGHSPKGSSSRGPLVFRKLNAFNQIILGADAVGSYYESAAYGLGYYADASTPFENPDPSGPLVPAQGNFGGVTPASTSLVDYPRESTPSGLTPVDVATQAQFEAAVEDADTEQLIRFTANISFTSQYTVPHNSGALKRRYFDLNGFHVDCTSLDDNVFVFENSAGYLWHNLLIKNASKPDNPNSGIIQVEGNNQDHGQLIFSAMVFADNDLSAAQVYQSHSDIQFLDFVIYDQDQDNSVTPATNKPEGFNINTNPGGIPSTNVKIVRPVIAADKSDDGLDLFGAENCEVIDAVIFRAGRDGDGDGQGAKMGGARARGNNKITGSLIIQPKVNGVAWNSSNGIVTAEYCTVVGTNASGYPREYEMKVNAHVARYNIAKLNNVDITGSTQTLNSWNLSETPSFFDETNGDFSLVAGSALATARSGSPIGATDVACENCLRYWSLSGL